MARKYFLSIVSSSSTTPATTSPVTTTPTPVTTTPIPRPIFEKISEACSTFFENVKKCIIPNCILENINNFSIDDNMTAFLGIRKKERLEDNLENFANSSTKILTFPLQEKYHKEEEEKGLFLLRINEPKLEENRLYTKDLKTQLENCTKEDECKILNSLITAAKNADKNIHFMINHLNEMVSKNNFAKQLVSYNINYQKNKRDTAEKQNNSLLVKANKQDPSKNNYGLKSKKKHK